MREELKRLAGPVHKTCRSAFSCWGEKNRFPDADICQCLLIDAIGICLHKYNHIFHIFCLCATIYIHTIKFHISIHIWTYIYIYVPLCKFMHYTYIYIYHTYPTFYLKLFHMLFPPGTYRTRWTRTSNTCPARWRVSPTLWAVPNRSRHFVASLGELRPFQRWAKWGEPGRTGELLDLTLF